MHRICSQCNDDRKRNQEASVERRTSEDRHAINHPTHYNPGTIEVITAIEDWKLGFHLGNVVKYVVRSPHKGSEVQDLEKAKWYLERWIEKLKGLDKGKVEEKPNADR